MPRKFCIVSGHQSKVLKPKPRGVIDDLVVPRRTDRGRGPGHPAGWWESSIRDSPIAQKYLLSVMERSCWPWTRLRRPVDATDKRLPPLPIRPHPSGLRVESSKQVTKQTSISTPH